MRGGADWCAVPAACILIAITTPVTFWSYSKMVQGWQASKDPDLVSPSQGSPSASTSAPRCLTFALGATYQVCLACIHGSHAFHEGSGASSRLTVSLLSPYKCSHTPLD